MKSLWLRCSLAMIAGLAIGVFVALLSIPVNVVPSLITGLMLGLLMAASESMADI